VRENSLGDSFEWERLKDIEVFFYDRDGPEHEFLDSELEMARRKLHKECDTLLDMLAMNTWRTEKGFQSVPDEWEWENPKRLKETLDMFKTARKAVCSTYDDLVRLARKKLAV
jgi:hypothetical protein